MRLLRFSKPHVTDEQLAIAKAFSQLDYLAVVCPQVTDKGIAHLAGLTNLDTLMLSESGVTDAGITALAGLEKLERLYLDSTKIGDDSLKIIGKLASLQVLSLVDTAVTDEGLTHLSGLQQLDTLRLDGTKVTTAGIASIGKLENLRLLFLDRCEIEDTDGLERLKKLKHLSLNHTPVSDIIVDSIDDCESLQTIELQFTQVTSDGLAKLHAARPKLHVFAQHVSTRAVAEAAPNQNNEQAIQLAPLQRSIDSRLTDTNEVPDFQRHVVPLLGRLGCNSRSCHGSFQGQGGFQLSMFGYDFQLDHENLAARIDLADVDASLILNKPTSAEEHEGGMRLPPGAWQQDLLRRWISAGAPGASDERATFVRLDVTPANIVFDEVGDSVPLRAIAVWSDGTQEDVTCLTRFEVKDDAVASVTPDGHVTSAGSGDTHVIALYDNGIFAIPVALPISDQTGDRYPIVTTRTKIDEWVVAKLRPLGIVPAEVAPDEMFLRRVSLDLIGTLPTPDEIRRFVADTASDKRSRKIDELLARDAYVAWWTNLLCDLTGSNAGYLGGTEMAQPVAQQWRDWIELRVRQNIRLGRNRSRHHYRDQSPPRANVS